MYYKRKYAIFSFVRFSVLRKDTVYEGHFRSIPHEMEVSVEDILFLLLYTVAGLLLLCGALFQKVGVGFIFVFNQRAFGVLL